MNLNKKLDNTYLYYGDNGKDRWKMQRTVDENIYTANSEGYRYHLQYRISDAYLDKSSKWDLVDLYTKDEIAIADCDKNMMPDTLKFMKDEDLRTVVIYNKYRRKKIIGDIKQALAEKEQLAKEQNLKVDKEMKTFDITSIKWLKELLSSKGYTYKD